MANKMRVKLVSARLELNDDHGTWIDCIFREKPGPRNPKQVVKHRRDLMIDGVYSVLSARQRLEASKAFRRARRSVEQV